MPAVEGASDVPGRPAPTRPRFGRLRDSTGATAAELRARAGADGYLLLRGLATRPAAALRRRVVAACERRGWLRDGRSDPALRLGAWDDPRWIEFLQETMATSAYRGLGASKRIAAVLRAISGADPEPHVGDLCRLVSPGALDLTTPPHQDAAYLREGAGVWTAWMPLGACPVEVGPLAVLPGSHRAGLQPHGEADRLAGLAVDKDAGWLASGLDEGDVLLFSSTTVHRALPNRTRDRLRTSVEYRYRLSFATVA